MAQTAPISPDAPIAEINTTPLIDVMLVLLIMFVITIPVAAHNLTIDLPTGGDPPPGEILPTNRITLGSDGVPRWNGTPETLDQLTTLLVTTRHMNPEPELQFAPDAQAPYGTAAEVLRRIKAAQVTAATSSVLRGRTTASARPRARWRQSCS